MRVSRPKCAFLLVGLLIALAVPCSAQASRNLYVAHNNSADLTAFGIEADGSLTQQATTPLARNMSTQVALTPDGRYLYAAQNGASSGFSVSSTGALTPLAGSSFTGDYGVTVTLDGQHLYAADSATGVVNGYLIGASGALTPVPGASPALSGKPAGIATTPGSKFLYVTDYQDGGITGFSIGRNGALTSFGSTGTGSQPSWTSVTPDGRYLYVGNYGSASISAYSIAPSGALTELPDSPYAVSNGPFGAAPISPDGAHIYVTDYDGATISTLGIGGDGSLTTLGSPQPAGMNPTGAAVTPDGKRVFSATETADSLYSFTPGSLGVLSPVPGFPVPSGGTGADFGSVAISPDQPPTASFTATSALLPFPVATFDAGASTDPDGSVESYVWDFGDGTTDTTIGPRPLHRYASTGTYRVSLRVIDKEGCSTTQIYTGQNTLCNGSGHAEMKRDVTVEITHEMRGVRAVANRLQWQGRRSVVVTLRAGAAEATSTLATGRIRVRGLKASVGLEPQRARAGAGHTATFHLRPALKRDARRIVCLLAAGRTATVKLQIRLDGTNSVALKRLTVKLRRR